MKTLCFQSAVFAVFLLVGSCTYQNTKEETGEVKPNFLILVIDDLGETDIGCYGNDFIETPNIDKLAGEGMKWLNAYSAAPVCSPARVALLTGKNPARVNFTGHIPSVNHHRHPENSRIIPPRDLMYIPLEEVILPEAVKPAGYKTISIGKWHLGYKGFWPVDMGFDENIAGWTHGSPPSHFYPYERPGQSWNSSIPTLKGGEEGEYLTDRLTDEAIEFMQTNQDQPFLLYLSHYAVHQPLQAPEELVNKYKRKLDEDANGRIDPVYAAMVESVDRNVGRVLNAIENLGLRENTVVILASDNGAVETTSDMRPYRDGKGSLYQGGIRVPFVMRWPEHIPSGSVSEVPTKTEDIYATIVDIVGDAAEPGSPLDGRSLVGDFKSKATHNYERELHWYFPHYIKNQPGAAIILGQYKFIEFYDPHKIELYNIVEDPGETKDISEQMVWKTKELEGKLRKWLHDIDPILHTPNPDFKPVKN